MDKTDQFEDRHFGALTLFAFFASLPFLWMLITTFKQDTDLYNRTNNPFIFNMAPTLSHLKALFYETLFLKWLVNTAMVGVLVVAITLVLAIPAGYSLVRLGGRTGERLGMGIFMTYLVAPTIQFIPMSRVIAHLGLQDSLWSLVVVFPSFTVPFAIWLLMGFFKTIPKDLEEAAMIDGYSRLGAFFRMVIPISTLVRSDSQGKGPQFHLLTGSPQSWITGSGALFVIYPDRLVLSPDFPGDRWIVLQELLSPFRSHSLGQLS